MTPLYILNGAEQRYFNDKKTDKTGSRLLTNIVLDTTK